MRRVLAILVLVASLLTWLPVPAAASASPQVGIRSTPTHIQLIPPPDATVGSATTLLGVLHDSTLNVGIPGMRLSFSMRTTFGWLLLGNVTTNGQGKAAVDFRPADPGDFTIHVSFAGDGVYASTDATEILTVLPTPPTRPPLVSAEALIVLVIAAVVGGVWATYAFVGWQVLGVRADAPVRLGKHRSQSKSEVRSSMEEDEMDEETEAPKRVRASANKTSRTAISLAVAALVVAGAALAFVGISAFAPKPAAYTPRTVELQIAIVADLQGEGWDVWLPNELVVHQGDTVKLTVLNADEMLHGLYIKEFNVDREIPEASMNATGAITPSETLITFTPDQVGQFLIKCNVICGPGHEWMIGTLVVLPG